jgi:hypothetical protein
MIQKYRYYDNIKSGKTYLVLSDGIIYFDKKEVVVIIVDGNTGKTIMINKDTFIKEFKLKLEPMSFKE